MKNPWEKISLSDYENHMQFKDVMQLQAMNEIMYSQINDYNLPVIMILGIAGGNGLNHISTNPATVKTVYGVDINEQYLSECKARYPKLHNIFIPLKADLQNIETKLPEANIVIANLLIEYIGLDSFQHIIQQTHPEIISCVIQINSSNNFVSESPYTQAFRNLNDIYHYITADTLINSLSFSGYQPILQNETALPGGKILIRIDFNYNAER